MSDPQRYHFYLDQINNIGDIVEPLLSLQLQLPQVTSTEKLQFKRI